MTMHLESRDRVDAPAALIYPLVRDRLPDLTPFLPDIDSVQVLERKDEGPGLTYILNLWKMKTEIPGVLQRIIKPEYLAWKDYAHWQDEHYHVDYKLEGAFYSAQGRNSFKPSADGLGTDILITCSAEIHADKIPGVPAFIVRPLLPLIETFVKKLLGPNLTMLAKGVKGYVAAHQDEMNAR